MGYQGSIKLRLRDWATYPFKLKIYGFQMVEDLTYIPATMWGIDNRFSMSDWLAITPLLAMQWQSSCPPITSRLIDHLKKRINERGALKRTIESVMRKEKFLGVISTWTSKKMREERWPGQDLKRVPFKIKRIYFDSVRARTGFAKIGPISYSFEPLP